MMMHKAKMMETPSSIPFGNPCWISPMISETMAAPSNTLLIKSSKFSKINSQIVLICGAGNSFLQNL